MEQLDKPKPVKVPQCVAEWIEEARKACKDVVELFEFDFTNDEVGKWFMQERPFDLVARAWLDGYEVEEEKRYTVVTKATKQPLYYNAMDKKLFFSMGGLATKFTRKQLEEAGVGWMFDCPGIEIEEVE
ncbi:phage protein [Streptococcus pneumoniae]|nr:phage protein [Streptococcus pneumoniae]